MASVSSSTLIIFIASILVAASVAGTMTNGVQRLSGALSDRSVDVSHQIETDVSIISDPGSPSAVYDGANTTLTLLVKNTGSESLPADASTINVIVDGEYKTAVSVSVVDGSGWQPGNVLKVDATNVDLSAGDHRVVVLANGDREVLELRVS
ncbi:MULTISPECIES: CARDB domain-containing protein [Halobacterium]|uniref:Arl cluster protein ArlG n=3 Tax=Halobacterium salinarum TaxID=2242 RepID=A0A510N608_HALSA|nr:MULTISPECIES: CARDB domain-containing protein [Halobacterium]MBB6090491.1 flagellar protein FlaG [Halobacterium salinarum]MCF2166473.1 flagellar protein G [Halobacterium salinarum]MCF2168362.1 flagellar protein G [Halobacterium salinarum]MCF2238560.1 flagellar protein G [Halobacterium salinarum]MDL0120366.1 CARDB domain-containing protein [Halobacterium salinarum]